MTSFEITYSVPGMMTFAPLIEPILAGTETGAREMFKLYYPAYEIVGVNVAGLFKNNGRYSRFFTISSNVI